MVHPVHNFWAKLGKFGHSGAAALKQPRASKQRTQRPLEEFPFPNGFSRGKMPVGKKTKTREAFALRDLPLYPLLFFCDACSLLLHVHTGFEYMHSGLIGPKRSQ